MGTEDKDMPNQNLEFGNRLKTFRTLNGLTQGEVAEVLNLDRSTYTYYEKGRVPNLDTLRKGTQIAVPVGQDVPVALGKHGKGLGRLPIGGKQICRAFLIDLLLGIGTVSKDADQ